MHRYDVTDWERHGWRWHKLEEPTARAAERSGEELWAEDFGHFAEDVYHRMIVPAPTRRPAEAGGQVWDQLHDAIDAIPEAEDLRERCIGDERAAGFATQAILDTVIASVCPPHEGALPDVALTMDELEAMRGLWERHCADPAECAELNDVISQQYRIHREQAEAVAQAAAMMDTTDLRNAVRAGCAKAREAIDAQERTLEAFGCGQDAHTGRRARYEAGRKVAKLVAQSARLRSIVDLVGRLKRIAREQQAKRPDVGADEYIGVELGADAERLLPVEWAASAYPDLEDGFYQSFAEGRLQQIELAARPQHERGPIVMLLDSSGSMTNNNAAEWAAAVCMAFLDIAVAQKRGFALVHFGGSVLRVDRFARGTTIDAAAVAEAVSFFAADGGTNFDAALTQGMLEVNLMPRADVVMVTDGCATVSSQVLASVNGARKLDGLHVYSILIGSDPTRSVNQSFSDSVVELSAVLADDSAMHALFGAV